MRILIVDDDAIHREMIVNAFPLQAIAEAGDLQTAEEMLRQAAAHNQWPDVVVLDAMFYKSPASRTTAFLAGQFLDRLAELSTEWDELPPEVILVSGQDEAAKEFDAIADWLVAGRLRDVLPKSMAQPGWHLFQAILRHKIQHLLQERKLRVRIGPPNKIYGALAGHGIITRAECMIQLWRDVVYAAQNQHNIYIHGETGTGKELVVEAISSEQGRETVSYDWDSSPTEVIASVILGSVRGGFTGAEDRKGLIEEAEGKNLFVDELFKEKRNLPLLRAADEEIREFRRVGEASARPRKANCRFIFGSTISIFDAVREGLCSEDMIYRLAYINIKIPPLRERRSAEQSDISLLTTHFLEQANRARQKKITLDEAVYHVFEQGQWPHNVRALKSWVNLIVERCESGLHKLDTVINAVGAGHFHQQIGAPTPVIVRAAADVTVPATPQQLYTALCQELQSNQPRIWPTLGKNPKADEEGRHPHEDVVIETLRLVLNETGRQMLAACITALDARTHNHPRRINVYKVLLYLALHAEHKAELKHFTDFLGLSARATWNAAAEELRHCFGPSTVTLTIGERNSKLYTLSRAVLA